MKRFPIGDSASALTRAVVRKPGENYSLGLTAQSLGPPDFTRMLEQHEAYVRTLEDLGLSLIALEADPAFPDGCFVEDTAVVTEGLAVITRPGAPSRRGEEDAVEAVLGRYRRTERILAPGTLDGGDVLFAGRRVFIGISSRTNAEGARQLGRLLEEQGYSWSAVPAGSGIHLKSSVNDLGAETLIITRELEAEEAFRRFRRVIVEPGEEYAANMLQVNGCLIAPAGFPRTREMLERLGLPVITLNMSEARKMDGGLTCLSLRF